MKKAFIIGFLIGAIVIPLVVALGLIVPFFEYLRVLAIFGIWAVQPFLELETAGAMGGTVHVPALAWIVYLGVNGLVYGFIGIGIAAIVRKRKSVNIG